MRIFLTSTFVCAAVLCPTTTSLADNIVDPSLKPPATEIARARLKEGNALYKRAKWDEAAAEYTAGAAIEDAPIFDFNLGQCFRLSGESQLALTHYERFLDRGNPGGEVLSSVQGFIAELRSQLARSREMPPTGPAPTPLIAASGGQPDPSVSTDKPTRVYRHLGWGLTIGAIAGAGTAAYLLVDANSLQSQSNEATRTTSERVALRNRADSRQTTAAVVGISSGLALTAGVVTLILSSTPDGRSKTAWNIGVKSNSVLVFGVF